MEKKKFYSLFDLESFNGHELKFDHTYYGGMSWHSNVVFYIDGKKMELEEYYSQAYIPFDKRDNEIATVDIKNGNGVGFGRKVKKETPLKFEEFESLLIDNLTICGYKKGDMLMDLEKNEPCRIVAVLANPLRLRLDYVKHLFGLIQDFPEHYFYSTPKKFKKIED